MTFGQPDSLDLARALVKHGANPNARIAWKEIPFDRIGGQVRLPATIHMGRWWASFIGATPFWLAAQHNDVPLMRLLLENGADPHIATIQNITPLMAAAGMGSWDYEGPHPSNGTPESDSLEAVRILVEETGADVNATTTFAEIHPKGDPAGLRYRYLVPEELPATAAYGDMRWGNATALHAAAFKALPSVIHYLVDHGARLDAKTSLGWTPATIADSLFGANLERVHPGDRRAHPESDEGARDSRRQLATRRQPPRGRRCDISQLSRRVTMTAALAAVGASASAQTRLRGIRMNSPPSTASGCITYGGPHRRRRFHADPAPRHRAARAHVRSHRAAAGASVRRALRPCAVTEIPDGAGVPPRQPKRFAPGSIPPRWTPTSSALYNFSTEFMLEAQRQRQTLNERK